MHNCAEMEINPINNERRRFVKTTAGGVVLAASGLQVLQGCSSVPSNATSTATSAWQPADYQGDVVRWALSHAILAPNPHNLQPWLVDLSTNNEMLVSIDPDRLLPETDPFGRQILIGTGAMLGLFELAAAVQGYEVKSEWVGNSPDDGTSALEVGVPILRATIEKHQNPSELSQQQALFTQITRRRTSRNNYDLQRKPATEFLTSLEKIIGNGQSGGVLNRADADSDFLKIADSVKQAWEIELETPATAMESIRLLRIGKREINQHRDGIAIDSTFLVMLNKLGMIDRTQPLKPGSSNYRRQITQFNDAVDSSPAWFYLASDTNTRLDQLEVGKSFVLAQLQATELGMVMHPVSQGLQEYPEMSDIYRSMTEHFEKITGRNGATLQMLARIGYLPAKADEPMPAPRRGVDAHIIG